MIKSNSIKVYSIFSSIQGESTKAGLPCTFVRLAGCPLNCSYCDTQDARVAAGIEMSIVEICQKIASLNNELVEITGGEPLFQENTFSLLTALCDEGFMVLLETSGAFSIKDVDSRVHIVLDVKTPKSNMSDRFEKTNLKYVAQKTIEIKFVISSKSDFDWSVNFIKRNELYKKCDLLISPTSKVLLPDVARWILESILPLRLQLQLHKMIWPGAKDER